MTGSDPAAHVPVHPTRHALTDPRLTGMSRDALDTLLEKLIVPYVAAIEQRRHRQRGGTRRPGTRGGVFRQKIRSPNGGRILATILDQRQICTLDTPAELFDISRSALWNAIKDVLPVLDNHHLAITPRRSPLRLGRRPPRLHRHTPRASRPRKTSMLIPGGHIWCARRCVMPPTRTGVG